MFPYHFPYNTVEKDGEKDHGSIFKMLTRKYNTIHTNSFITVSRGLRYTNGITLAEILKSTPRGRNLRFSTMAPQITPQISDYPPNYPPPITLYPPNYPPNYPLPPQIDLEHIAEI